ncbi:hypothetical protein ATN84_00300 [Paramesorhizobium deserti]|uniref:Uncharacterized protein n=1 Tax=Paramesorhizobium deserti TaxID=1494590 RepID=A0A135HYN6_9HYPH|nr:hypothetical protein ATN84_00300 [Paramesorhizobium deserti]
MGVSIPKDRMSRDSAHLGIPSIVVILGLDPRIHGKGRKRHYRPQRNYEWPARILIVLASWNESMGTQVALLSRGSSGQARG